MLYVTTRNNNDAFTAHRVLTEDFAPDGGGYVPFQLPVLDVNSLQHKQFSECVATVLNVFFSGKLTAWDIEFAIGRNPMKLSSLSSKITVAELYSNPEGKYNYIVKALYRNLLQNKNVVSQPSKWAEIAIRIATLFGIWSDMLKLNFLKDQDLFDISLSCLDHKTCVAAVYARKMCLPINRIILSCNEGNPLWDLIIRGEVRAEALGNAESGMVERMLETMFGNQETIRYLSSREQKKQYTLSEDDFAFIKDYLFAAVVGSTRTAATISNVARKDGYTFNSNSASAYSGLEDFRAKTGISRPAVLIAECGC